MQLEFIYDNPDDEKLKVINRVKSKIEEGIAPQDFALYGKSLYFLGNGHGMLIGFFSHFATDEGTSVYGLHNGYYLSLSFNNEDKLKFEESVDNLVLDEEHNSKIKAIKAIIEEQRQKSKDVSFDNFTFPIVKQVNVKLLADDIIPFKP